MMNKLSPESRSFLRKQNVFKLSGSAGKHCDDLQIHTHERAIMYLAMKYNVKVKSVDYLIMRFFDKLFHIAKCKYRFKMLGLFEMYNKPIAKERREINKAAFKVYQEEKEAKRLRKKAKKEEKNYIKLCEENINSK